MSKEPYKNCCGSQVARRDLIVLAWLTGVSHGYDIATIGERETEYLDFHVDPAFRKHHPFRWALTWLGVGVAVSVNKIGFVYGWLDGRYHRMIGRVE